jgi:hypothetical protein
MLAGLTATNKALTQLMTKKDTEISALKKKLQDSHGGGNYNRNRTAPNTRNRDSTKQRYTNDNYCWTHGFNIHNTHTSQSCNFPIEGHQRKATPTNTKGGSNANKEKVA